MNASQNSTGGPTDAASEGAATLNALRSLGAWLLRQPRMGAWIAPLLWMALIWFLSSRPVPELGDASLLRSFVYNLAHGPEFAILAVLVLPLLPRSGDWVRLGPWQVVVVLFIAGGYGIVDELHQASVPGRVSSLGDILTDLGAVASTLVVAGYVGSADATTRGLTIRLVSCTVFVLALVLHATFE